MLGIFDGLCYCLSYGHFFPKLINICSRIWLISSAGILSIKLDINYLHIFVHSVTINSIIWRESVNWYVLEQKFYVLPLVRALFFFLFFFFFPFPGTGTGSESDDWFNSSSSSTSTTVALKERLVGSAEDDAWPVSMLVIEGPGIDGGTAAVVVDEVPETWADWEVGPVGGSLWASAAVIFSQWEERTGFMRLSMVSFVVGLFTQAPWPWVDMSDINKFEVNRQKKVLFKLPKLELYSSNQTYIWNYSATQSWGLSPSWRPPKLKPEP